MDGVAVIAGNPLNLVPGHVPKGQILLFAMAGKAFGGLGLGIREPFAEDEDAHASLTAFFHVGRPRTMAGLAAFLAGRATGNAFFGVSGNQVGIVPVLMASLADFRSNVAIACFYLKRE